MEMIRASGRANDVVQVQVPNLLHKFLITSNHFGYIDSDNGENQEEDEDELTLGLSLNGQFGTDPRSRKRKNFELGRSSSIPEGFVFDVQSSGGDTPRTVAYGVSELDRTRSLPVETETKRNRSEEKTREFEIPPPVNGKGKNVNTTKKKDKQVSGMEKARNILEDMPCVSTRDVGADGKRVEGFLYWYGGKKEEVKIVCVCHGSFLSPAEFVMHSGGTVNDVVRGDVAINPLRHIVVKLPSSSL